MRILILYATETGNAEMLADDLAASLSDENEVKVSNMSELKPEAIPVADLTLVITSTYGDGEVPTGARGFYEALGEEGQSFANRPFAVFGLGDRQYEETFGQAARLMQDRLCKHGGLSLADTDVHDASGSEFAEDQAMRWCEAVIVAAQRTLETEQR